MENTQEQKINLDYLNNIANPILSRLTTDLLIH